MSKLGLGTTITKGGLTTPGIVTDNLVLKHNYAGGEVVPVSDGAAYFDGTDDYIDVGDSNNFITGNNVTLACWFRVLDNDGVYLIHNQKSSGSSNIALTMNYTNASPNAGYIALLTWNGSSHNWTDYDGNVNDTNEWWHIAATTTASAQKLYLNGVEVETGSNTFANAASTDNMSLGSFNGAVSNFLKGNMCNVGVWNAALTQAQIKSIMWKNYAGLTDSEKTNLVSWWNLDSTIDSDTGVSMVYDNHSDGSTTLGSELWYNGSSVTISDWTPYGDNTVEEVDNAIKITCSGTGSGHAAGAYIYLSDRTGAQAGDAALTSNLVVGETYKLSYDVKVDPGDDILVRIDTDGGGTLVSASANTTSSTFESKTLYFKSNHATNGFLYTPAMSAGEVIYLKNFSLKLVNGNVGVLT